MMISTIRSAAHSLLRNKRGAALTILCIAMGVAASATALSLAWTVTLRPLPFPNGDRLVRVWLSSPEIQRLDMSIPDLRDIEAAVPAFERFAGTARTRFVALFGDGAARLRGEAVTPGYLEMLAVRPRLGRVFTEHDHDAGASRVALISAATWRRYYGSDPNVVGELLRTERASFEIAGVLESGFDGSIENDVVEFWIPISQYLPAPLAQSRLTRQSWAFGLLRPGASIGDAREQLRRLGASLAADHGAAYRGMTFSAEPFAENWRAGVRGSAVLLLVAAVVLLVIAIVNVSGMSLARALDRRREFALRQALGAGAARIAALPFAESAVTTLAGGALGAAASPFLLDALLRAAPITLPAYLRPEVSGLLALLVAGLCMLAAVAAGLLPALEARRAAPAAALRDGGRGQLGTRGARRSRMLVVAQVSLTTGLVVVVALLGRSFQALNDVPLGYRTDIARLAVTASPSDLGGNAIAWRARMVEALEREPGVREVGLAWPTLPPWDPDRVTFSHSSLGDVAPERLPRTSIHAVDDALLGVLGIELLAGRGIESRDGAASSPVVVISESMAQRLGGRERALGTELVVAEANAGVPLRAQVVGIVGDVAWDGLGEQDSGRLLRFDGTAPARMDAYYAIDQVPGAAALVSIAVRVSGDPAAAIAPLSRALGAASPMSAVHWASAMRDELAIEYRATSFALFLSTAFGMGALLLAGAGVFAMLSHNVAGRVPEFAIRLALGASPAGVRLGVLRSGLALVAVGCVVGGAIAAVAARGVARLLYAVSPADPVAYAVACLALLAVSVLACWVPARRASRVDPMQSLRG